MAQERQDQVSASSSWKRLELENRSTSFPSVVHNGTQLMAPATPKEIYGDSTLSAGDGSVKSWAKTLHSIAQNTISVSSPSKKNRRRLDGKMIDLESTPHSPKRTPVLIMTLIKLHDVFETFCNHLTGATYTNVQNACSILDSTTAAAATPKNSEPNSPICMVDSPGSHRSSSPSMSPITSWLIGSYTSESSSSRKSEWETCCNPLIIFAGLEAMYSASVHVESYAQAQNLVLLYEKNIDDLGRVRKVLCDPFINPADSEVSTKTKAILSYKEKAAALGESIDGIMSLCRCRCKLIEEQRAICHAKVLDAEKVIDSCKVISRSLPKQAAKATLLVRSASKEVELLCDIIKLYSALRKVDFLSSVISCQKVKLKLQHAASNTCIQKWMHKVFHSFVSLLPIYFDRSSSDILSRYGFRESSFRVKPGENKIRSDADLETKLEEFLRIQDRSKSPLVIAVVVDASAFSSLRSISEKLSASIGNDKTLHSDQLMYDTNYVLSSYPAIYFASTIQDNPSNKPLATRKNSGRKSADSDHSQEPHSCSAFHPRADMDSWPCTSWSSLVSLLKRGTGPLATQKDSLENDWSQIDRHTSVFVSAIQDGMWFVGLRKTADEGRWNLRNGDENAKKEQQFFIEFSKSLRLSEGFISILEIRSQELSSVVFDLEDILSKETILDDEDHLSELFQEKLGLRLPTNYKYSFRKGKQNSTNTPSNFEEVPSSASNTSSHYAFFLGSALMDSI